MKPIMIHGPTQSLNVSAHKRRYVLMRVIAVDNTSTYYLGPDEAVELARRLNADAEAVRGMIAEDAKKEAQ